MLAQLLGDSSSPRVFYACGTDHADRCGLYEDGRFAADIGVVVVPRAGEAPEAERPPQVFVAEPAPGDVAAFSSTQIRGSGALSGARNRAESRG